MEISVTRALTEIKAIKGRLNRIVNGNIGYFVTLVQGSKEQTFANMTIQEFTKQARAAMQSNKDLMARRKALKNAIVNSNAVTKVKIGGVEMTVAEAIEYKLIIQDKDYVLSALKEQLNIAERNMTMANDKVERELLDQLKSKIAGAANQKGSDIEEFSNSFRKLNLVTIVDPINIRKEIADLEEEIAKFKTEVDYVLSESNTKTLITVAD